MVSEDTNAERSSDEDTEKEWSAKHLLIGIALPAFPWILAHFLGRWSYLKVRPWFAIRLLGPLYISGLVVVILYYIFIRNKFK